MFALYHSHLPRWYANVHSLPALNLSYYRSYTPHTVTNDAATSFCKLRCYFPRIQTTIAIATESSRALSVTSMMIDNTGNTNKATTTKPLVAKYKPQHSPFFVVLQSYSVSLPGLPCWFALSSLSTCRLNCPLLKHFHQATKHC